MLELVLDERPEHRREGAREEHGGGDRAGGDELDVVVAADVCDQRAEAEAEGEQVDRRLDRRGERRGAPVRRVVDDLAHQHAGQRRAARAGRSGAARSTRAAISRSPRRSAGRRRPRGSRAGARRRSRRRRRPLPRTATLVPCGACAAPSRRPPPRPRRAGPEGRRPRAPSAPRARRSVGGRARSDGLPWDMISTVSARRSASSM